MEGWVQVGLAEVTMRAEPRCPVVVVDDEPDYCELVAEILREEGHEVATFTEAQRALVALRASPRPALLLLDWRMPRMDGPGLLEALEREGTLAGLTVLVCSVMPRIPAHPAVSALLRKPFHIEDLLDVVGRHAPQPACGLRLAASGAR